jgi:hypothetical protein
MMHHGREYIVTEMDGLPCWKNHENMLVAWLDSSIQGALVPVLLCLQFHIMMDLLADWLNSMTYSVPLAIQPVNKCSVLTEYKIFITVVTKSHAKPRPSVEPVKMYLFLTNDQL